MGLEHEQQRDMSFQLSSGKRGKDNEVFRLGRRAAIRPPNCPVLSLEVWTYKGTDRRLSESETGSSTKSQASYSLRVLRSKSYTQPCSSPGPSCSPSPLSESRTLQHVQPITVLVPSPAPAIRIRAWPPGRPTAAVSCWQWPRRLQC